MCISRATVSAVSCLVVPAFICIDLFISLVLKINDDDEIMTFNVIQNGAAWRRFEVSEVNHVDTVQVELQMSRHAVPGLLAGQPL